MTQQAALSLTAEEARERIKRGDRHLVGATISGTLRLAGMAIGGALYLEKAIIRGDVDLTGATISGYPPLLNLKGAVVYGDVILERARIGWLSLDGIDVKGDIILKGAVIEGSLGYLGNLGLRRAQVQGNVDLAGAAVGYVDLVGATVNGSVSVAGAVVEGDMNIVGVTIRGHFDLATQKGPYRVFASQDMAYEIESSAPEAILVIV